MAQIPGSVPITGVFAPTDDTDTYAITDPIWGIDGLRSVANNTARNAIPNARRREGMMVYTQDTDQYWRLLASPWAGNNTDWVAFTSADPYRIIDADSDTFVTTDNNPGSDTDDISMQVGVLTNYTSNHEIARLTHSQITFTGASATGGNTVGGNLSLITGNGSGNLGGGTLLLNSGNGGATGVGGPINVIAGNGGATSGNGGALNLNSGDATTSGTGGGINIEAGNGANTGQGGTIFVTSGDGGSTSGSGGFIFLVGGNAQAGDDDGGSIALVSGDGIGTGASGNITMGIGVSGDTGVGGMITIVAGDGGATSGNGGALTLNSGGATSGAAGDITLEAGDSASGAGGNITLTPGDGTTLGAVMLMPAGEDAGETTQLRFLELNSNGSNYVGFKSPNAIASSVMWTLPNADGSSGQVLSTNGSGVLSWTAAGSPPIYHEDFNGTSPNFMGGVLTATHNLGTQYNIVQVYDNNDIMVIPDEITATSTTVVDIDLNSFGTITGTWRLIVLGGSL